MSIWLELVEATEIHEMWDRRLLALKAMYPTERPCFVDRDGDWCLRDFLNYTDKMMGGSHDR